MGSLICEIGPYHVAQAGLLPLPLEYQDSKCTLPCQSPETYVNGSETACGQNQAQWAAPKTDQDSGCYACALS